MQTYKIHSIVNSAPAQYGKTRVVFKLNEMGEKMISCFTKFPESIKEGAEIKGEIKEVEKDGKTYYNFEFKNVDNPTAPDRIEKVLDNQVKHGLVLQEILRLVTPKKPQTQTEDIDPIGF
jgi:hypothetical protein